MPWQVQWAVEVDGRDVSSAMRPTLLTIEVADQAGAASDTCNLTFDDTGGQIALPPNGRPLSVRLDGATVFSGVVDLVRSDGSRGSGRVLTINAKGFDTRSKAKERVGWHLDDATLGDALKKGARLAGLDIVVDPALAGIKRGYWGCHHQHFMEWADSLARDLGATFKIRNDRAVFAKRGTGLSAAGGTMPIVRGSMPGNVINWSITPSRGRPQFSKSKVRWFDRKAAEFKEREVEIQQLDAPVDVTNLRAHTAADDDEASDMADARKTDGERDRGAGTVTLDLAAEAQAEGTFVLSGTRPGIDGAYRITGVMHRADRTGGSTTTLDLAQPQGDAAKDSRVPVPTSRPAT